MNLPTIKINKTKYVDCGIVMKNAPIYSKRFQKHKNTCKK